VWGGCKSTEGEAAIREAAGNAVKGGDGHVLLKYMPAGQGGFRDHCRVILQPQVNKESIYAHHKVYCSRVFDKNKWFFNVGRASVTEANNDASENRYSNCSLDEKLTREVNKVGGDYLIPAQHS
jgi:hypothetical protein